MGNLATFRRKIDETAPCGRGSESALAIFSHLQSRDRRECLMGLRPTNKDEKHAGGECRTNRAGLRACFSIERLEA